MHRRTFLLSLLSYFSSYLIPLPRKLRPISSAGGETVLAPLFLAIAQKAQAMLKKETPKLIYSGKKVMGRDVPIAIYDLESNKLAIIQLQTKLEEKVLDQDTKKYKHVTDVIGTEPIEYAARKAGGNGINTTFEVTGGGKQFYFLGWHYIKDDASDTLVYTPYADFLAKPEIVAVGKNYLETKIEEALAELRRLGVGSRAYPDRLVADLPLSGILFNIAQIEHMDHDEYEARGAEYMSNKVLTQLALNGENTFSYSQSFAGALGLMQIMPSTYRGYCAKHNKQGKCLDYKSGILQLYPSARLPSDPVRSRDSHILAIKAAALVLDDKLTYLGDGFRARFMANPARYGFVPAAAYNGGPELALGLYKKISKPRLSAILADLFSFLSSRRREFREYRVLREETWVFIKKYIEVDELTN